MKNKFDKKDDMRVLTKYINHRLSRCCGIVEDWAFMFDLDMEDQLTLEIDYIKNFHSAHMFDIKWMNIGTLLREFDYYLEKNIREIDELIK